LKKPFYMDNIPMKNPIKGLSFMVSVINYYLTSFSLIELNLLRGLL
jgi:hypothetical protein